MKLALNQRQNNGIEESYPRCWPYLMPTVAVGETISFRITGTPGMPVRLRMGAGVQSSPRPVRWDDLLYEPPRMTCHDLGAIPGEGVMEISVTVPSHWNEGDERLLQALVGSKLTNVMMLKVGPSAARSESSSKMASGQFY